MPTSMRGARFAAPLVLLLSAALLAACSSSSSPRPASAATSAPSSTPTATTDAAAVTALAQAQTTLRSDRSYRFDATVVIATTHSLAQRITGSVVRNQGVAYTFTSGRNREQVVRLRGATYVRVLPGKWSKLRKPRPVTDPTASLLAVLRGIQAPHVTGAGQVTGVLDAAAAKTAGVPTVPGARAAVVVTLDAAHHVTRLTIDTKSRTTNATASVPIKVSTSYSAFNRVPALHKPV
jgi:hypothetical protein